MRSKLAILTLLCACLWGRQVHADTIVDITATWCTACMHGGEPVDFHAQVTVMPVAGDPTSFGAFFNPLISGFYNGPVLEVTGVSGTLNGSPISFRQAPFGDGSWLYPDLFVGALYFTANGQYGSMFWDGAFPFLTFTPPDAEFGVNVPVNYTATAVTTPEPATLGLLGMGFLFLCWRLKATGLRPA